MAIKLSDICDVRDGTHDSPRYVDSGFPLVTSKNIINGKIDLSVVNYLSQEDYDKINQRSKVDIGDIIMPMIGTIGNPCLIEDNCDFAIKNVALIKFPDKRVINKFIWYFLKSKAFIRYVEEKNRGGTQKFISLSDIRSIIVPELPISQQCEIIEKLDKLQLIITHRQKQLEKLDELIKARFVEMFGDVATNALNWKKEPMGDYMTLLTDFSANGSYEYLDSNVRMYNEPNYALMVRTTDLEKNDFENDVKYIDEKAYNILSKSKVFGNEIIMNKIGSAGKIYLMPVLNRPVSLGRNAFMFRFNDDINIVFLYFLLTSDYGEREIQQHVRGAVTKTITKEAARSVKIIIPPIELQNQFADFVKQVNKSKVAVQKELDKTKMLFDSLMQEYFG